MTRYSLSPTPVAGKQELSPDVSQLPEHVEVTWSNWQSVLSIDQLQLKTDALACKTAKAASLNTTSCPRYVYS